MNLSEGEKRRCANDCYLGVSLIPESSALFNGPAQTILSPNISEFKFHPPYYRCRSPFVGLFYNSGPDLQITLGPFSNIFSLNSPLISCPKKTTTLHEIRPRMKMGYSLFAKFGKTKYPRLGILGKAFNLRRQ